MTDFVRRCGAALLCGGVLLIVINAIISPFYLQSLQQGEAVFRSSGLYLLRISLALLDALLLLVGCIGLHLGQRHVSGRFGALAFLVAFVGTSLLFAVEWANLFVLRPLAQSSPEALPALDRSTLMTAGFATGAICFMLGWLLLAVSIWRSRAFPAWAAAATAGGLLLIPALAATPLGQSGQIVGNVICGVGLIGLGRALSRSAGRATGFGALAC